LGIIRSIEKLHQKNPYDKKAIMPNILPLQKSNIPAKIYAAPP
jgi:hypothetical protein